MEEGIYESLHTVELRDRIKATGLQSDTRAVEKADQPHVLARHVASIVERAIAGEKDESQRIMLANSLLSLAGESDSPILDPAVQLARLYRLPAPGVVDRTSTRPETPLSEIALLTNSGRGEPSIGHELKAELASADRVDLLCAFIKWSGVRLLETELQELMDAGKPFRVITTTYLGSTERKTLDRLAEKYGAEVRVQYDALRTRLHAKAWMFHRDSGFDTAYIGSSNLSNVALIDGVEWNVRLSRVATPSLLNKFRATFESYWSEDPGFEEYIPDRDGERLDRALREASGATNSGNVTINVSGLEVRPYPYQQTMLDELQAEREVHDRHRNLVVAATGTGKTVLAALDYRRLIPAGAERPRLLFVAHTREILVQAQRTFREVLADGAFGELLVNGERPERWDHVFASVQSLRQEVLDTFEAGHFEVIVVDEFHHGAAPTYRRLVDHFAPRELVGLTATPERADGLDVREYFGGRIATELRLWDALGAELLCPFHYFGIADGTDLSAIAWKAGKYDQTALGQLYTGNDARVRMVLQAVQDKLADPGQMRALGFCVSIEHARYMADKFSEAGIPSAVVSGQTGNDARRQALSDLCDRRINAIFSVDVFNEGLDIKEIDTVLMLRPTESATIFLQQLGRGLRRTSDKAVLTVMDFVGHQREEFRWDKRLRALTGIPRGKLVKEVEMDFPYLPSGCRIELDRQTQSFILENVKRQLNLRRPQLVAEVRSAGEDTLAGFLEVTGIELASVIKGDRSWTALRREAGVDLGFPPGPRETEILRRSQVFAHVDDEVRVSGYKQIILSATRFDDMSETGQLLAKMLFFSIWPDGGKPKFASVDDGLDALRQEYAASREFLEIMEVGFERSRQQSFPLNGACSDIPLRIHARYTREEVLAGLGHASLEAVPATFREGVKYIPERNIDAMFVTLVKTEGSFSPTTMYRDYPISRTEFHWESQSTTSEISETGRRYINGDSRVLLFVRVAKNGEYGTVPYEFLGPAKYMGHSGERPMAITWRLDRPMSAESFGVATAAL
ncbi:DEAD/DEAH box helicase [Tsukamurella serpentis]